MREPTIHNVGFTEDDLPRKVVNFASLYEPGTLEQASQLARGHVTEGHVVMLPDAHVGAGACVGTAVRTRNGLYPAAVGVDIGCGMIAVQLDYEAAAIDVHMRRVLRGLIERAVPSGVAKSRDVTLPQWDDFTSEHGTAPLYSGLVREGVQESFAQKMRDTAAIQFGTLGSGNHFIELSEDENGYLWAIVHSGSRGVGNNIARYFIDRAKRQCQERGVRPETPDLAFVADELLDAYVANMLWAQAYAFESRQAMMDEVLKALLSVGVTPEVTWKVNCHHNYSERQPDGAWLTRKGAIDASQGTYGVLPGSMSTDTYITAGLGNELSYNTAPHGAGRLHARGRPGKNGKPGTGAWAKFTVDEFKSRMEARGVVWQDRSAHYLLDESEMMYKPIEVVLDDAASLIKPMERLVQIVNYKGL